MDIKQRVMDDAPNSWLHKIARIVPGFKGYMDRERRRDADKLLRTHLARQFSAQRDRLNRAQQSLLRARRMDAIGEVDRLSGVLQRLIDRIERATYGYSGMFDPVKIEAEDLDQLYAFDMALASGVDQVGAAIDALEDGEGLELDTAVKRLSDLLDDLNERMNQRSELLTSGKRLPSDEYQSLLDRLEPVPPYEPKSGDLSAPTGGMSGTSGGAPRMGGMGVGSSTAGGSQPGSSAGMGTSNAPNMGMAGTSGSIGGDMARVSDMGSGEGDTNENDMGTPTVNLGGGTGAALEPGLSSLSEGNQSMHPMGRGDRMSDPTDGPLPIDDSAGGGVQSASSPAGAPGTPGHDVVDGLQMERNMERVGDVDSEGGTPGVKQDM